MSLFHLKTYRDVIQQKIHENAGQRGYKMHLSKKMDIQTSQLSQVLTGKIDLSPDQGSRLCDEWKFNFYESEYFLSLIALERATTSSLKKRVKLRLETLRQHRNAENSIKVVSSEVGEMSYLPFFTSWSYPAVYGMLRLDDVKSEDDLAKRLELPLSSIKRILKGLSEMNLIERQKDFWSVKDNAALSASRQARSIFHSEMRAKAHQMFVDGNTDMFRTSAVTVVSADRYLKFRDRLEALLTDLNAPWDDHALGQDVAVLNIDFFRF